MNMKGCDCYEGHFRYTSLATVTKAADVRKPSFLRLKVDEISFGLSVALLATYLEAIHFPELAVRNLWVGCC